MSYVSHIYLGYVYFYKLRNILSKFLIYQITRKVKVQLNLCSATLLDQGCHRHRLNIQYYIVLILVITHLFCGYLCYLGEHNGRCLPIHLLYQNIIWFFCLYFFVHKSTNSGFQKYLKISVEMIKFKIIVLLIMLLNN